MIIDRAVGILKLCDEKGDNLDVVTSKLAEDWYCFQDVCLDELINQRNKENTKSNRNERVFQDLNSNIAEIQSSQLQPLSWFSIKCLDEDFIAYAYRWACSFKLSADLKCKLTNKNTMRIKL